MLEVDPEFLDEVGKFHWRKNSKGYWYKKRGGFCFLSRFVWGLKHSEVPPLLDHKDRNPSNNRLDNLRPATRSLNSRNSQLRKSSKGLPPGVVCQPWCKKPFLARCYDEGRFVTIGRFETQDEAAAAYLSDRAMRLNTTVEAV